MKDFEFNPSYHGLVSLAYCNMTLYSGGSEMQPFEAWKHLKTDFSKIKFQMVKGSFEFWTFLSGFQMVLNKMVAVCLDFK